MNVLGVDLGLAATGLVVWDDLVIYNETFKTPAKWVTEQRTSVVTRRILDVVKHQEVQYVFMEGPAWTKQMRGHFQTSMLHGVVRFGLWKRDMPWMEVQIGTIKKRATGDGRADKAQVFSACIREGFMPGSQDEADAYWVARIGWEAVEIAPSDGDGSLILTPNLLLQGPQTPLKAPRSRSSRPMRVV